MAVSQSSTVSTSVEYRSLNDFGCPAYRVGSDGSVWTCFERYYPKGQGITGTRWHLTDTWKPLKTRLDHDGRPIVSLRRGDRYWHVKCHVLVLLAFVGPKPPGMEACHGPKGKADNSLSNLRWDTKAANEADKVRDGVVLVGERHPNAILTDEKVRQIKAKLAAGATKAALGREYGVSESLIRGIETGQRWRHVA